MNPHSSTSSAQEAPQNADPALNQEHPTKIITGKASKSVEHSLQPVAQLPAGGETAPGAPGAAQSLQFVVPPLNIPLTPPPAQPAVSTGSAAPAAQPAADLGVVDDADLIEKEWVNKAKEIVAMTRDDPYKQSEELTVFKADYMKKRYDKHIKLSK